jgi:hypothetical protein
MAGLLQPVKEVLGYGTESEDKKALGALQGAADVFKNIPLPELQALILQNPQWLQDVVAPTLADVPDATFESVAAERAKQERVDGTAFDNVSTDPRLKEQQLAALASLKEISDGGGMTAKDKANLWRVQSQAAQADAGRRDAIMQGMARRGMGGSGAELLAQLSSSQAATDRQAQEGLDIAGMAQERALSAMLQGGQLAGNVRGQDFDEQAKVAQARDAIAQFNAANANQTSQFNAGQGNNMAQFNAGKDLETQTFNIGQQADQNKTQAGMNMQANMFNTGGRQDVHNQGVANQNQSSAYNVQLPQKQFENTVTKAGGVANAAQGLANFYTHQGDRKTDEFGNLISGGATVGAGALSKSDERCKKDKKPVEDMDLEMFMATIQPKKFKYKDPADGEGDRTGVMAQDLLRSKLGQEVAVQFDDGTLGYDKDKMQGVMLAALKHLFDKIDGKKGA